MSAGARAERRDDELLRRARSGDESAFDELATGFRAELELHCYRIHGSLQDAEDLAQETLLAAWRGLDGFEGCASFRPWLYRIATNRCLNALRDRSRRPARLPQQPEPTPPPPTRLRESVWIEPYPDVLLEGVLDRSQEPDARGDRARVRRHARFDASPARGAATDRAFKPLAVSASETARAGRPTVSSGARS